MSDSPPPPPEGTPPPPPGGGAPPPPPSAPTGYGPMPGGQKTNSLAIASLVLSIVGVICCGLLSIAGIVTGFIARNQISKDPSQSGEGLALAGIIVGIAGIVLGIILFVALDGNFYIDVN